MREESQKSRFKGSAGQKTAYQVRYHVLTTFYEPAKSGPLRDAFGTNQGTNEEDSQSDPHPEAGILRSQTTKNSGPEVGLDSFICSFCRTVPRKLLLNKAEVLAAASIS